MSTPHRLWRLQTLSAAILLAYAPFGLALPTGGVVSTGQATVSAEGGHMVIQQGSQNAVLNWQGFNIGSSESVQFVQPNRQSVALNRVVGSDPSQILGRLSANGQVFLVNPSGIVFGQGAQVNVGGLVASTLNLSDGDFMARRYRFMGTGSGAVSNQGSIQADGGAVALLGQTVFNEGLVSARLGSVSLAAGRHITLDVVGDGLLTVTVNQGAAQALVSNRGTLQADGGQVLMTAQAAGDLLASAVNNTGIVQAQTIETHEGVIRLLGGMDAGTLHVGGVLDASAPQGGNGGFIETSASRVQLDPNVKVSTLASTGQTGRWLIDPVDFTIAASGGDITGAALSGLLSSSNVTIQTASGTNSASQLFGSTGWNGDIFVNDAVNWSAHQLTLHAWRNIEINTAMIASGSATLAFEYGQGQAHAGNTGLYQVNAPINLPAGASFTTQQGYDGATVHYTVITGLGAAGSTSGTDLQGINGDLTSNYALGSDIDATATGGWNAGAGFTPIGLGAAFAGTFDGLGHTISGLSIQQPSTDYVGLFSRLNYASVRNLSLSVSDVAGHDFTGAMVGRVDHGDMSDLHVVGGQVNGANYVGGLAGVADESNTERSHTALPVHGVGNVGGLIGFDAHIINASYATGDVSGGDSVGGLTGASTGNITNSYATGNVTGANYVGGLTGYTNNWIWNAYATGNVTASGDQVGGLIGHNGASVHYTYSTGAVVGGGPFVGGLAGYSDYDNIDASFWDVTRSGQSTTAGGARGMTTADMQLLANFNSATAANGNHNPGWNLSSDWILYDGHTSPLLRTFMTPLTVTVASASKTYDGTAYTGLPSAAYSTTPDGRLQGTLAYGNASGHVDAGTYWVTAQGLYSDQQGYAVSYAPGDLVIHPATVTLSATKVYDGSTDLTGSVTIQTGIMGESLNYTGAQSNDAYVATSDKYINTLTLLDGAGGLASNYQLPALDAAHAAVTITAAPLTATVTNSGLTKIYDGTTSAPVGLTPTFSFSGLVSGDSDALLSHGGAAYNAAGVAAANKVTFTGLSLMGITGSNGSDVTDYALDASSKDVVASITRASLTVVANDASKIFGTALPALTASVTGFVAGETLASAGVTGQAQLTTLAEVQSPVGRYDIVATAGTLTAGNYDFTTFVPGALSIESALPSLSLANAITSALIVPVVNKASTTPQSSSAAGVSVAPAVVTPVSGPGVAGLGLSIVDRGIHLPQGL